jgi:hypothetical protein
MRSAEAGRTAGSTSVHSGPAGGCTPGSSELAWARCTEQNKKKQQPRSARLARIKKEEWFMWISFFGFRVVCLADLL